MVVKCIQNLVAKHTENGHLEELDADGRIIFRVHRREGIS